MSLTDDGTPILVGTAARVVAELTGEKPPGRNTMWNWATRGLRVNRGDRVVLETVSTGVGGGSVFLTTRAAVRRFLERTGKLGAAEQQVEELAV
jgi:hypothetical protein